MSAPHPLPIRCSTEKDGGLERIVLARPKANVLDIPMVKAIREHVHGLLHRRSLRLVVFEGEGPHFSFGASVPEHLPAHVRELIPGFHALFRQLEALGVPTAAVVRGQCLGGALELAAMCGRVVCDRTARFGVPEVKLGVFPPIAPLAFDWRGLGARGASLILTGETVEPEEALRIGLVDQIADDPAAALDAWYDEHLAPKSAVAVRYANRAGRRALALRLDHELPALEGMYLEDLMQHVDPHEGLNAFLEKRQPAWRHE